MRTVNWKGIYLNNAILIYRKHEWTLKPWIGWVCLLAVIITFSLFPVSCSPCYYTPNAQNVPLLDEGREGIALFSFQGGLYTRGINLQTAFSPFNHLGFMFNYQHFWTDYSKITGYNFWTGDGDSEDGEIRGNLTELGAGYFLPFQEKFIFEVYSGLGWGSVKNEIHFVGYNHSSHLRSTVKSNRYFIQPAIGWSPNKHFEIAFSNRFCLLEYKDLSIKTGDKTDIYEVARIDNNPLFLFEPAVTIRIGGENIKFQYQACYSNYFGNSDAYFDPLAMSFAIFVRINGKQKE